MRFNRYSFRKKPRPDVPTLNTASLPDLIFTVLFFFMLVTHMRSAEEKVQYTIPQGRELQQLTHKAANCYIFIGRQPGAAPDEYSIQINDKLVKLADVEKYVEAERAKMASDDQAYMTVTIKADKQVPVGLITDVKKALKKTYALKINYSASEK
ncbi:biopolymer transporter ExbD [Prevotella sp. E13-17]|uniref:ExbD/TolR family protein n=1 Tax=Prevotella sp. E13-17 TaxID=2913616 RepID=UPI001EDB0301|nr:biopolymer transporter ExbD [Prevotella sp. E13-17]UKK51512.1 biopolymer transporter ExbD [Prevotella sp. E13-17]